MHHIRSKPVSTKIDPFHHPVALLGMTCLVIKTLEGCTEQAVEDATVSDIALKDKTRRGDCNIPASLADQMFGPSVGPTSFMAAIEILATCNCFGCQMDCCTVCCAWKIYGKRPRRSATAAHLTRGISPPKPELAHPLLSRHIGLAASILW